MSELPVMTERFEWLKGAYLDAAAELRSKHVGLQDYAAELATFIALRDQLKAHPDFSGALPASFFSGSDLDADGVEAKDGLDWDEPGTRNWG